MPNLDLSLAQWSLNQAFFSGELAVADFPRIARERYGILAVEYVTQFFQDKAGDTAYLKHLKQSADDQGVNNLLVMIDHCGELASADPAHRTTAIDQHHQWLEAAALMGCDRVRVNLHGSSAAQVWHDASCESLRQLGELAQQMDMKILVENHGGLSSNAGLLVEVIRAVNLPNVHTMPDFGNFCIRREVEGDLWHSPCIESYDIYRGVEEMLPFAGAVSAKAFEFDAAGNELNINFFRMLKLMKAAGYSGYIGIEYEGKTLAADDGIRKTKALLLRALAEV